MQTTALATVGAFCLLTLLAGSRVARAQTRTEPEERPIPGIISHAGRSSLNGTLEAFGGYDHTTTQFMTADPETFANNGQYVGGLAGLFFGRPLGRYTFQASGSSDFRYYPQRGVLNDLTAQTSGAGMSIGRAIGQRGTVHVSQNVASSSFYEFNPFAGFAARSAEDLILPQSDYQIQRGQTTNYDLQVATDWRTSRRDSLSLNYSLQHVWLPGELLSLSTNSAGARFNHRATRTVSLVLGYSYEQASRFKAGSSGYHRIDSGIQYASHVFTRHTTVSASTGAAVVATRDPKTNAVSQVFDVIVNAGIRHEVTRSWSTGLEYRREPQIVDLFTNPTYTDSFYVFLTGRPSRKINASLSTGYAMARLDAGRGGSAHQTFFGTARGNWLLARRTSAYVEYSYYGLHASPGLLSPVEQRIDRQAIRVGLNWSLPLLTPGGRQ